MARRLLDRAKTNWEEAVVLTAALPEQSQCCSVTDLFVSSSPVSFRANALLWNIVTCLIVLNGHLLLLIIAGTWLLDMLLRLGS